MEDAPDAFEVPCADVPKMGSLSLLLEKYAKWSLSIGPSIRDSLRGGIHAVEHLSPRSWRLRGRL